MDGYVTGFEICNRLGCAFVRNIYAQTLHYCKGRTTLCRNITRNLKGFPMAKCVCVGGECVCVCGARPFLGVLGACSPRNILEKWPLSGSFKWVLALKGKLSQILDKSNNFADN